MKANMQEIMPGIGLGALRFGNTREEVKETIGEADEIEKYSLDEFDSDDTEAWHYDNQGLSLSFDEDDDWKLSSIAVSKKDYLLNGISLVGISVQDFKNLCEKHSWGVPEEDEEIKEEDAGVSMYHLEHKAMSFWFEADELTEVQMGMIYEDCD